MVYVHLPHSSVEREAVSIVINAMVYLGVEDNAFLNLVSPQNLKASNLTFHLTHC